MDELSFVYLDTETTGLDPERHEIVEIAYAIDDGPVIRGLVEHTLVGADPKALEVNRYFERGLHREAVDPLFELELRENLEGVVLVGANPAFDAGFLRARWGAAPWKYRLLDVESYAMPLLGYGVPQGLKCIAEDLQGLGWEIPMPDHSAAADVETLRTVFLTLQFERQRVWPL